jgi:mRNA interferase MazF
VKRDPQRGEVRYADLGRSAGREQRGRRPVLVVSIDQMNRAPAELVLAVPLTTTYRGIRMHVRIDPEDSGLPRVSYAMPEMLRHLTTERLEGPVGRAPIETVDSVARHVGVLIGLGRTKF